MIYLSKEGRQLVNTQEMNIRISPKAANDLDALYLYLSEKFGVSVAKKFNDKRLKRKPLGLFFYIDISFF